MGSSRDPDEKEAKARQRGTTKVPRKPFCERAWPIGVERPSKKTEMGRPFARSLDTCALNSCMMRTDHAAEMWRGNVCADRSAQCTMAPERSSGLSEASVPQLSMSFTMEKWRIISVDIMELWTLLYAVRRFWDGSNSKAFVSSMILCTPAAWKRSSTGPSTPLLRAMTDFVATS